MALPTPTITYYLDGVSFTTYSVYVSATRGIVDLPKMKEPVRFSAQDLPGEYVDLSAPQFDVKEFSLDCWIQATSILDFMTKVNTFFKALILPNSSTGTHRLQISIDSSSPLVYQVYCPDGAPVNARFSQHAQVGTFTLKLREPEPVKKIYKFSVPGYTVSFSIVCTKPVNFYWGDLTATKDILAATSTAVPHAYGSPGWKYIILTGDMESITYLTTTATLVWDKLL